MVAMNRSRAPSSSRWPTGTEYSAAVQQPTTSFGDPELRNGELTLTPLGIPASASGQNAIAFHMQTADRPIAVRCLLSGQDDGGARYRALGEFVTTVDVPAVVSARWLDEGIRVHGRWWPVVVMPWAPGDPLHIAVEDRLGDPGRLGRLGDRWLDLVETLQDKQFAHGDYQHGNVLVTDDDEFQLVDLDGIWVPAMGLGPPDEYGHPNYQHVNRSDTDWGPHVDTFSALAVAVSILGLAADPDLARFMTGENLLFVKSDFEQPDLAPIWRSLAVSTDPDVVDLGERLQACARAGRPPMMSLREIMDAPVEPSAPADIDPASAEQPEPLPVTPADGGRWWGTEEVVASAPLSPPPPPDATPPEPATSGPVGGHVGSATPTSHPVLAGLVSGAVAGLVGSIIAGVAQGMIDDPRVDGGLVVGAIAALLGAMLTSWSAFGQSNYSLAVRRFLVGGGVGLVAGLAAVGVADVMTRNTLEPGDTENALLVAYVWAIAAALIGVAIGALNSARAAAYAFSGGAVAGFVGGLVHGSTTATFEARALQVDGFDGQVMLTASFVAMLVGVFIAIGIRSARHGSLTVIEGPGRSTVIDVHSDDVTVGGSPRDTVVVRGRDLGRQAIRLVFRQTHAEVTTQVPVTVDGVPQPQRFHLASGKTMGLAGVFIRVDIAGSADR